MKKSGASILVVITLLTVFTSTGQTGMNKKVIATLGAGEVLANGENCLLLSTNPESISFVTVTGSGASKQYFCYGKMVGKSVSYLNLMNPTGPVARVLTSRIVLPIMNPMSPIRKIILITEP